jgi:hypothetical protein
MSVKVGQALAREGLRHDEWYLGYECQCCGAKIPVSVDGSRGETAIGGFRFGPVRVSCPHCARKARYHDSGLLRFKYQGGVPPGGLAPMLPASAQEP